MRFTKRFSLVLFLVLSVAGALSGQAAPQPPQPPPSPEPVQLVEIMSRADQAEARLRAIQTDLTSDSTVTQIRGAYPELNKRFTEWWSKRQSALTETRSIERAQSIRQEASIFRARALDWDKRLATRSAKIQAYAAELQQIRALWAATREATSQPPLPGQPPLPAEVGQRIASILQLTADVQVQSNDQSAATLAVQSELAATRAAINSAWDQIASVLQNLRGQLFVIDSPPLWKSLFAPTAPGSLAAQVQDMGESLPALLGEFVATYNERLPLHAALFVGLALFFLVARRRLAPSGDQDAALASALHIVRFPVSAALLVALLIVPSLYPNAPTGVMRFASLLVLVPLIRLLPGLLPASMHRTAYLLAALVALDVARGLLPSEGLLARVLLFVVTAMTLAGIAAAWRAKEEARLAYAITPSLAPLVVRAIPLLLGTALVANIIGSVALAGLLTSATLRSGYVALVLLAGAGVLDAIATAALRSPVGQMLRVARVHGHLVAARARGVIHFAAGLTWILVTLRQFRVFDPLAAAGTAFLQRQFAVGSTKVSPGDVVAFLVTLGVAYAVSRLVRFVLGEEVLPRLTLARGVPGAVSMLTHYVVLLAGFLLALAAAGMDLSHLTILASAFGVGVGFGLQNVANNFISGLILAFERPIQGGDIVQMGPLWGRVQTIGFRASVIRSFDGADVIVPNGQLTSQEVVNWTRSDQWRRMDVPVGVAYGTDPHRVIRTLLEVAEGHSEVLKAPKPDVLFERFGDSSLEFTLRCWTGLDGFLHVRSQVTTAINDAFQRASIVIAFPQRDVHISWPEPAGPAAAGLQAGTQKAARPGVAMDAPGNPLPPDRGKGSA